MSCHACGRELADGEVFCPGCGASQGDRARDRTESVPVVSATAGLAPASLVDCARCGGRNAPSRVLCGRCGADLATGEPSSGPRRRPPIMSAAEEVGDAIRSEPDRASTGEADTTRRRSAALPLLVGVLVVATLLGGAAGAMAALGLGPFAPQPPSPPPAFDPSDHPDEPRDLTVAAIEASTSHAPLGDVRFGPGQLVDGELSTAWNSGGHGTGDTITVDFGEPVWLTSMAVANGFQRDDARFLGHARVVRALISLTAPGQERPAVFAVTLLDQRGWQTVDLAEPMFTAEVTIEVTDVVAGDTYDELAISELRFRGWPAG